MTRPRTTTTPPPVRPGRWRALRLAARLTQQALARKMGVSAQTIWLLDTDRKQPTPQQVQKLLDVLKALPLLTLLLLAPVARAQTVYVSPAGNDATPCSAITATTPRRTLNAGIACLAPGDELHIAAGTYPEILMGQMGPATNQQRILSILRTRQANTQVIPNGPSCEHPTRIRAAAGARVVISPTIDNPETGTIVMLYGGVGAKNLSFEGLHFLVAGETDEGRTAGLYLGGAACVTVRDSEIHGGGLKSSGDSRTLVIERNYVHDVGTPWCDFTQGDPSTNGQPCPHLAYLCGTGHRITHNRMERASHSGAHVSCEQSNSDNVVIHANTITDLPGKGIILDGGNGQITANRVERAGVGIFPVSSTTLTANNTISGYFTATPGWVDDPFAIMYYSAGTIVNNLILAPKSSFNAIAQQQFQAIDTSQIRANLCTVSGNVGCPLTGTTDALVTNYAAGDFTLTASSPARGAGVATQPAPTDITGAAYPAPPDLGAYAYGSTPAPEPEPPQPPSGPLVLACTGELGAQGRIEMTCTQQEGR